MSEDTPNRHIGRLLLDGAFLIAFGTALLYFYGIIHLSAYYDYFGLRLSYVENSRDQILPQGAITVTFVVFVTSVTLLALYRMPARFERASTMFVAVWPLASFTTMVILIVSPELLDAAWHRISIQLLLYLALSLVAVVFVHFVPEFMTVLRRYGLVTLAVLLALYLLVGVGLAHTAGVRRATATHEGTAGRAISLTLLPDSPMESVIDGKRLVLVASSNERYYLVEHTAPATDDPLVYIVEKSQVAGALLSPVGAG